MKTGIDNKGHPNIKTVGLVGGDEACFTGEFAKLFVPITRARHGFMEGNHVSDMDVSKLTNTDMDPFNAYVRTARVRTGRSSRFHSSAKQLFPGASRPREENHRCIVKLGQGRLRL